MATPQIGGKSFLTWAGPAVLPAAMAVQEITRDNADGHAFAREGKRAAVCNVLTMVDVSSATTEIAECLAFKGTLQTVKNIDGASVTNVMVRDVRQVDTKALGNPVGGVNAGAWLVTMQWELQATW
jgi:hypothetical protein